MTDTHDERLMIRFLLDDLAGQERAALQDRAAADAMIAAQMPSELKRDRSDFVIDNDGDFGRLQGRARAVWEALLADADTGPQLAGQIP